MKNVWVSIREQWGVQNTKGKYGDARICEGVGPKKTMRGILPKARGYSHGGVHVGVPPSPHEDQNVHTPGEGYRRLRIVEDLAEIRMRGIIAKKHADIDGEE